MPPVDSSLPITQAKSENTARTLAILLTGTEQTSMSERVIAYISAMAQARRMLVKRLITQSEYVKIDAMMLEKYYLSSSSIYRDIRLITAAVRANMSHHTGVIQCPEP